MGAAVMEMYAGVTHLVVTHTSGRLSVTRYRGEWPDLAPARHLQIPCICISPQVERERGRERSLSCYLLKERKWYIIGVLHLIKKGRYSNCMYFPFIWHSLAPLRFWRRPRGPQSQWVGIITWFISYKDYSCLSWTLHKLEFVSLSYKLSAWWRR